MHVLSVVWISAAIAAAFSLLTILLKSHFLALLPDLHLYGKVRNLSGFKLQDNILQVPRRWFRHFYLTGVVVNSAVLTVTLHTAWGTGVWPEWFQQFLVFIGHPGTSDKSSGLTPPLPVVLAIMMEEIQVIRRSIETLYINSYSSSKMSVLIYAIGILFYSSVGISILSLADMGRITRDNFQSLTWTQWYAIALFLYASWKQFVVNRIMAKLRQDKNGNVTNTGHHIPHGDMFEYVSCPHFSMEIFIYIAISTMVGWQHQVCMSLCLFVFTNQLIQGYLVDKWYRETFPKYPSRRKAVLPFIF